MGLLQLIPGLFHPKHPPFYPSDFVDLQCLQLHPHLMRVSLFWLCSSELQNNVTVSITATAGQDLFEIIFCSRQVQNLSTQRGGSWYSRVFYTTEPK